MASIRAWSFSPLRSWVSSMAKAPRIERLNGLFASSFRYLSSEHMRCSLGIDDLCISVKRLIFRKGDSRLHLLLDIGLNLAPLAANKSDQGSDTSSVRAVPIDFVYPASCLVSTGTSIHSLGPRTLHCSTRRNNVDLSQLHETAAQLMP